jgi:hypothetical protein
MEGEWRREKLYLDIQKMIRLECVKSDRKRMISRREVLTSEREAQKKNTSQQNLKLKRTKTVNKIQGNNKPHGISIKTLILEAQKTEVSSRLSTVFTRSKSNFFRRRTENKIKPSFRPILYSNHSKLTFFL